MPRFPYPGACTARSRALLALAAVCVSLGSFAVLLGAFQQSSPQRWLQPTPMLMADIERCKSLRDRGARDRCSVGVVQARSEPPASAPARFAQR